MVEHGTDELPDGSNGRRETESDSPNYKDERKKP
jgi:hypothetical protein